MFLNNRYHHPTLGGFISVDPLITLTGEAYIYGTANPVTFSDPTGLCPFSGCWEAFDAYLQGLKEATTYVQGPEEESPGERLPLYRVVGHAEARAEASLKFNSNYNSVGMGFPGKSMPRPLVNPQRPNTSGNVDWILVGQVVTTIGVFTPCSAWCAAANAGLTTYAAYDECSQQGLSTSCGMSVAAAGVSVIAPVAGATSRGAAATSASLGDDAAALASRAFTVTARGVVVSGPRLYLANVLSNLSYYSSQVATGSRAVSRIAQVADLAFLSAVVGSQFVGP